MNENAGPRYRVVTVIQPPFVMYNATSRTFYGYCIDLLNDVKSLLGFDYDIRESFDGQYGMLEPSAEWTGGIYELQTNRSDIFVGAMWQDLLREYVVDFTIPFYRANGFAIMMKKPVKRVPLLKFLTILDIDVWGGFVLSFVLTSILIYLFERYSPCSRSNTRPTECDRFTSLKECFWFTATSITPQGGGSIPENLSGKLAATAWWLFAFIIVSTYTANLAGYETLDRLETYIESMDDLINQYQVEYSTLENSTAHHYFSRMSRLEALFHRVWEDMSLDESLPDWERSQYTLWDYPLPTKYANIMTSMETSGYVASVEGVMEALRMENSAREYAFIGEAMLIRYLMLTNCGFRKVGEEFSKKPFAFAVRKGSPLKDKIDEALTNLMIRRRLNELEEKWWDENPEKVFCPADKEVNAGFGLDYMGAVFLLISIGILLASVILIFQYYWYLCRSKREQEKAVPFIEVQQKPSSSARRK